MITVVIRNKNEAVALEKLLVLLDMFYKDDIAQVIVVDNLSTDGSSQVIHKYGATLVNIDEFTYGRALNIGIENSTEPYIALLSSHAYPLGNSFFKDSVAAFEDNEKVAGLRYINSFEDYERFINNDGVILEPLNYGLMNACSMIRKTAWKKIPFNERLMFSEDKKWSQDIVNNGYIILQMRHSFFYNIKRDSPSSINRWSNENLANLILHEKSPSSKSKSTLIFMKSIFIDGLKKYGSHISLAFKKYRKQLSFSRKIKEFYNHE